LAATYARRERSMRAALLAVAMTVLVSISCRAADLVPRVSNQAIGASILELPFPESLARDLTSGFENRVLVRVSALSVGKAIERRDVLVTAKYDLWEEKFAVRKFTGGSLVSEMTFKQTQEVITYLGRIEMDNLFAVSWLQHAQDVTLQAEVSINPVEHEKIERVRKWVAGNSVPGEVSSDPADVPLTSKPNDLFNKIFDQYIRGEDIVATWKITITSKPFKPPLGGEAAVK
jgi:hypothetical protein